MPGEFPADIEQFLQQHIESLAQLEALLMLRKEPARFWYAEEVAKALYTSVDVCAAILADLQRRGLLRSESEPKLRYQYHPADEKLDQTVARLSAIYQERRVAVITQIYSKPVSNVQTFADAFRLRGK
jgi:hypothetical protein